MPIKMYTRNHREDLLRKIDNGEQINAEESHFLAQTELNNHFTSKDTLLEWYLSSNGEKLEALAKLVDYVYQTKYFNVLSLGAGPAVLEYLLKMALPSRAVVVATDFNPFFVNNAQHHFPEIQSLKFDFASESVHSLKPKLNAAIDVAVFFGSAYALHDSDFINLMASLRSELGVKAIIDFHAGCVDPFQLLKMRVSQSIRNTAYFQRTFSKPPGKFHGYARTPGELKQLYSRTGCRKIESVENGCYKFAAKLEFTNPGSC